MLQIRLMTQTDVPALNRLQIDCYPPELWEDESTLSARLLSAPETSWVAEDESGVCAYLFGYRSMLGKITPLNGHFTVAAGGDTLYLHDLAVAKRCRGQGVGRALVRQAWEEAEAEGLAYSALVSVQGSKVFWQELGYRLWDELPPAQRAHLGTYPGPAYYMVGRLGLAQREPIE